MGLNVQVGSFSSPGATGNQTVTLPTGFDCKAVILRCTIRNGDGVTGQDVEYSVGFGTYRSSVVAQYCLSMFEDDAATSAATALVASSTAIIKLLSTGTATVDAEADLVSLNANDFVINWADIPAATREIHYIAFGGSAITDALVHIPTLTVVASEDITVTAGFGQPDLIFTIGVGQTRNETAASAVDTGIAFGVANRALEQRATLWGTDDGITTQESGGEQVAKFILEADSAWSSQNGSGSLSAVANWPTDGFQIDYDDQLSFAQHRAFLSLKGNFVSKITSGAVPTAAPPQSNTHSLDSGRAKGAIVWGGRMTSQTTWWADSDAELGGFMMGFTDGTNENVHGLTCDDGAGTMVVAMHSSTGKFIQHADFAGTPAITSEADSALSGRDLVVTWSDTDTVAREYSVLIIGEAPSFAPRDRNNERLATSGALQQF